MIVKLLIQRLYYWYGYVIGYLLTKIALKLLRLPARRGQAGRGRTRRGVTRLGMAG
jgi:hypothetical protein